MLQPFAGSSACLLHLLLALEVLSSIRFGPVSAMPSLTEQVKEHHTEIEALKTGMGEMRTNVAVTKTDVHWLRGFVEKQDKESRTMDSPTPKVSP